MKKTLIFDVDGTFFNSHHKPQPATLKSLKKAIEKGFDFILASGRPLTSLIEIADSLEMKPKYLIGSNGGAVMKYDDREIIYTASLEQEFLEIIFNNNQLQDKTFVLQRPSHSLGLNLNKKMINDLKNAGFGKIENISVSKAKTITNCSMLAIDITSNPLTQEQKKWIEDHSTNFNNSIIVMPEGYMDIFPKDISKGNALSSLEKQGILSSKTSFTFGDGLNDVEMHQWAHKSFAMGQALLQVKESATNTIADNNTNSISETIESLL